MHASCVLILLANMLAADEPATPAPTPSPSATVHWSVKQAGAVGDGRTDDTNVLQRLLDDAGRAGGGVVEVPAGRYAIQGTLTVPARVTLQGIYRTPPTVAHKSSPDLNGSVLLAFAGRGRPTDPPFIRLAGDNAVLSGLIVAYPEVKQSDVPPVPYPPCVSSENTTNVAVLDCLLLNPYEGIRLEKAHRHNVRNVMGYPIKRGLYVDMCGDIGRIENVHFWPFGIRYRPDDPFCQWVNTEGVAFELARTDWEYVLNTFCFGYGIGYKFSESKHGSANGNFLGLGADCCQRAVVVEQAQPPGLLITNGEFVGRWGSKDAVCLEIGPKVVGKVSLVNCSFWGPIDRCVWMRSPLGQFTAGTCNFVAWDVHDSGSPALQLDAGRAIVQGCTFEKEGPHVAVAEPVTSAILVGNQAQCGFIVENHAGKRTQQLANQPPLDEFSIEAKKHYRVVVGTIGDKRYLRDWHGRENLQANGKPHTSRWSMGESQLVLPVAPGEPYTLSLKLDAPQAAISADAGVYLAGKRLVSLAAGGENLSVELPPSNSQEVVLKVVCTGWIPSQHNSASTDDRTLGLRLSGLTMKARNASSRVYNANKGAWESEPSDQTRSEPAK